MSSLPGSCALALRLPGRVALVTVALLIAPLALHSPSHAAGPPPCGVLVEGVHEVTNANELQAVGSGGTGTGVCGLKASYRQTANITIPTDHGFWTPIGSTADPFVGTFDGNNLTITGLQLDNTTNDSATGVFSSPPRGLFGVVGPDGTLTNVRIHSFSFVSSEGRTDLGALAGKVSGGTIENSHVEGTSLKAKASFSFLVGGLVGDLRDGGTIRNSSSQIDVSAGNSTGGLVGQSTTGTIEDSFATGTVKGIEVVGGLVGAALSSSEIRRSYASGNVEATGDFIGGLIGQAGLSSVKITDSFATGAVTGASSSDNVGGLVGDARSATISRSYSTGTVTGRNNVGGLIGFSQNSTVSDSFWNITTSGIGAADSPSASAGGVGKRTDQLRTLSTFTDTTTVGLDAPWPIVERWQSFAPDAEPARVWGIRSDLNDGYPFLLWEYDTIPGGECAVVHGTAEPALLDGSTDTYVIDSVQKLVYLSVNQNSGDPEWRTRNFTQTATIDLEGCLWAPIGTTGSPDKPFTGEYDGGGFPIDNLTIPSGDFSGLFGLTIGATITGVHLLDADLKAVGSFSGTLVGLARNTTISGSSATGSISASNANAVGGLVGLATVSTTISRSFSTVTVTRASGSGEAYGGLVGALGGASGGSSIESSFATGAVSADDKTGGLAGEVGGTSTISNSYARGAVTGDVGVGGLIGTLLTAANLTVTNSYATGKVSGDSDVGGLAGRMFSPSLTVTNSFWDKDTTEQSSSLDNKGSGETTTNMTTLSTFLDAGWPIVDGWQSFAPDADPARVWGLRSDLNDGYPFLLWEYASDPEFACGALVDGVFQVSTAAHLASVGSGGTTSGAGCRLDADYAQTRDIPLSGEWTPIGSRSDRFQGSFDGGGHTITGLSITAPTTDGLGLFGALAADGVVERVNLVGVTIESGGRSLTGSLVGDNLGKIKNVTATGSITVGGGIYTGGIVGYTEGSLTECSATVTIFSGDTGATQIGGVAGLNQNGGEIADCRASGDVTGGFWLGGLVGVNQDNASITRSFATGNVVGSTEIGANGAGGLVGINQNDSTISNSYATGDVTIRSGTGGLVGQIGRDSTVSNSYATGQPTGTSQTGGLVGSTFSGGNVVSSFYDTTTSGQNDTGKGEPKTTEEMRQLTTFANAGWSIGTCTPRGEPTVWGISDANDDYPFLIWQDPSRLDSCPEPPAPQTSTTARDPRPEQPVLADAFSNTLAPTSTQPSTPEVGSDTATETEGGSSDSPAPGGSQTGSGGGDDRVTSDDQAGSATQSGLNTGWLWGIGLGGLATVGLVAGGIALARNRLA